MSILRASIAAVMAGAASHGLDLPLFVPRMGPPINRRGNNMPAIRRAKKLRNVRRHRATARRARR